MLRPMESPSPVRFPSPQIAATRKARRGPWGGRRPLHFVPGEYEEAPPVGAYFARLTECERASLAAFRRFALELDSFGAPEELVDEARIASSDAVRHAEIARELAERFGAEPVMPLFAQLPPRGLVLAALDNAVEGCIRGTYGALITKYQAKTAKDLVTRERMAAVTPDKMRHASLAWRAGVWLEGRLSEVDVARLRRAQREEIASLGRELDSGLSDFECGLLGLPPRERALGMLERLTNELWTVADPQYSPTSARPPRVLESEPPASFEAAVASAFQR